MGCVLSQLQIHCIHTLDEQITVAGDRIWNPVDDIHICLSGMVSC